MMRVRVNGIEQELAPGTTLAELVSGHQLKPKHVAVEINCDLVPRRQFDVTELRDGDQIEIVTLVGGG